MKIGITCYPTYGGSGVVATELGMELAQRGHEIHFIAYSQPFRLSGKQPNIHFHEVNVPQYPLFQFPPYDLALATHMAEVAEIYGLDILHVHYAIPHSVSALIAKQMVESRSGGKRKLPIVTTLHGTDITLVGLEPSYLPVTRFAIEKADGVTAVSHYLRDLTYKEFEIKNNIEVIYNFVNCDLYQRDSQYRVRRAEFAKDNERLLVHLSNFRPVKRILDAIEIFDRIQKALPARLLMIGDGPDRATAEWLVRRKKIEDRVLFMGKQDRVNEKLAMCDLMLMPSEQESFGLAALEAMACEVPTVATAVGGVTEVIQDGVNGILREVGDVEGMASAAIALLSDEKKWKEMSQAARFEAQSRFCSTSVIAQYERFYGRVLARAS